MAEETRPADEEAIEPGPAPETPAEAAPIESRNRLAAAMAQNPGALADMCPEFNDFTGKWENNLNDERGNGLDVVQYDTEEEAEREIDEYCRYLDELDKAAGRSASDDDADAADDEG